MTALAEKPPAGSMIWRSTLRPSVRASPPAWIRLRLWVESLRRAQAVADEGVFTAARPRSPRVSPGSRRSQPGRRRAETLPLLASPRGER